jgi:hypothetical protein
MITSLGYGTYMFFGSLMVLMGFWAWWCIPETKGKTLEEMEALFGVPAAMELENVKEEKLGKGGEVVEVEYVGREKA